MDKEFSLTPKKFKEMAESIRKVEKALGEILYEPTERMRKGREFSRSLFVVKDIKSGEIFTKDSIKSIRPGFGLPPKHLKDIIGKKATTDIKRGTPLSWKFVE